MWTPTEDTILNEGRKLEWSWEEIGRKVGKSGEAARKRYARLQQHPIRIEESTYPIRDQVLTMEGNALILPDLEAPFHHADFVNRCLDLAQTWGITQAILAGDAVHFDSLSSWGPQWSESQSGVTEDVRKLLEEFMDSLPAEKRSQGIELLAGIDTASEEGIAGELAEARKVFRVLDQAFEHIDWVLGNHCSRWLRTFEQDVLPRELLVNLKVDNPKWRISPYFRSYLISNGEKYAIEHPVSSSKEAAVNMADGYECHVIMGHSHRLKFEFSTSGKYYAIQCGCCVDEKRLAYVQQRSRGTRNPHTLGAVIVWNGYPVLLHPGIPWEVFKKL